MDIQTLYRNALQHHQQGQLADAETLYLRILALAPNHADALHYLGVIYHQQELHERAIETIGRAIEIQPNQADFLSNQALALKAVGRMDEAIHALEKALALAPDDLDIYYNLGNASAEHEQYEAAASYYRRILQSYPQDDDLKQALCYALQSMGNRFQENGLYEKARAAYQEAASLMPNEASLYYNLANAQRELGHSKEAAHNYQLAIKFNPLDADAYNNLGNVQRELADLATSIASYQHALKLNPLLYHAKVHLVHQKQHACVWDDLMQDISEIRAWVQEKPEAQISPFAFLAMPGTTSAEQKQCASNWLNNRYQTAFAQTDNLDFQYALTHSKIRVGYLSADFRLHPLASLVTELIELHDRNQFEIYAYSYGPDDQSSERKRLIQAFDHFVDIRALSLKDAAESIHADEIDILVDLTGFTQTSRTAIVAMRPARLNISWLGFPGTMGEFNEHALFDYLLSDPYITPASEVAHYAERLLTLPHCYQPNDNKRPIGIAKDRAHHGLSEEAFVFCCFNQTFKILPEIFDIWMRLLKAKPNSILWLLACNPLAQRNLCREAEKRGVESHRLVFAERVNMADHLARHVHADLFLDTLPYNAHTTASDALWMGLPVLTCEGDTFAGRVAASLLRAAEQTSLITHHLQAYESRALNLANNLAELNEIKQQLLAKRDKLPLFNTQEFTKDLEALYLKIHSQK
jgi:protein O-GlcNAc transferase